MKLSTKLLTSLLTVTSTLAVHIKVWGECKDEIDSFDDCLYKIYNIDDPTNLFQERCQNYISNPLAYLPSCNEKWEDSTKNIFIAQIKQEYAYALAHFSKDENGNGCPLSTVGIIFDKEERDILSETCQSIQCTETAYQAYKLLSEAQNEILAEGDLQFITDYYDRVSEVLYNCHNGVAPPEGVIEYKLTEIEVDNDNDDSGNIEADAGDNIEVDVGDNDFDLINNDDDEFPVADEDEFENL